MTNKEKYRIFCENEENIPIFSKDWWLDSVCDKNNWDVILYEKNNKIIASFPYILKRKKIFTSIGMPLLTQSLGPYIKYPDSQKYDKRLSYEKEVMKFFIDNLPEYDYFIVNFNYNITNWLPFYWNGYNQTTRYTYVIENIENIESTFNNFSSKYKNKIRKAEKIVSIDTDVKIEEFFKINMMTFDRQKISRPYTLDFIKRHDQIIERKGSRKIFKAVDNNGLIHSALYLTWDSKSAYVHMVGEDPELRNSGAGVLLIWEAIKYTKNCLGLNRFDFEGSMLENIEQVRRSFGATQTQYFQITKINSIVFKIIKFLNELF